MKAREAGGEGGDGGHMPSSCAIAVMEEEGRRGGER
jgi:hypothetical protein